MVAQAATIISILITNVHLFIHIFVRLFSPQTLFTDEDIQLQS